MDAEARERRRRELREILLARVPQLTGSHRSSGSRNMSLVTVDWFQQLSKYVNLESGPEPSPLNNSVLVTAIASSVELLEGRDFEGLETNVYDLLAKTFSGGPMVRRPFLPRPLDEEKGDVVVYPAKVRVSTQGKDVLRTTNPEWTVDEFIASLAKWLKVEANTIMLREFDGSRIVPEEATVADIVKHYAAAVKVVPCASARPIKGRRSMGPREMRMSSGVEGPMNLSAPGYKWGSTSVHSLLLATVQVLTRLPVSLQMNEDGKNAFGECVLEGALTNVPYIMIHEFLDSPAMKGVRYGDCRKIVGELLQFLRLSAPFAFNYCEQASCGKCKHKASVTRTEMVIQLDVSARGMGKVKLDDAIGLWMKKGAKVDCENCGGQNKAKVHVVIQTPPQVLTIFLQRQNEATTEKSSKEVVYQSEVNLGKHAGGGSYRLFGVLSSFGPVMNQKYKAYVRSADKWVMTTEVRAREIESSVVMQATSSVYVLFYLRR